MRFSLAVFICVGVLLGSACQCEAAPASLGELGVAVLLSDGAVFGKVTVSASPGDAPGFVSGHIRVRGDVTAEVAFENSPRNVLTECEGQECVFLYHETPYGKWLVQFPRPALFRDESIYREFNRLREASAERAATVLKQDHCSEGMKALLGGLDGQDQQMSINALFSRLLSKDDHLCLASQIDSLAKLRRGNFSPPYASSEGIYHHNFPTRGDLIAFLLPHLTRVAIIPRALPLSATDRHRFAAAWTYAMLLER